MNSKVIHESERAGGMGGAPRRRLYISTNNAGSRHEKNILGCVTHQNMTLVVKIYFVRAKIYRPNIYKI